MYKVLAIVRPQFSSGFLLAGCDVFESEDSLEVEKKVKSLLNTQEYALVIIDEKLVKGFSPYTKNLIFESTEPVFIEIGLEGTSDEHIIREIESLARDALGYAIKIKV
ncbi:MAG: V-type ATP synthase subunit F [candidate division WOR-3 bacterium]